MMLKDTDLFERWPDKTVTYSSTEWLSCICDHRMQFHMSGPCHHKDCSCPKYLSYTEVYGDTRVYT